MKQIYLLLFIGIVSCLISCKNKPTTSKIVKLEEALTGKKKTKNSKEDDTLLSGGSTKIDTSLSGDHNSSIIDRTVSADSGLSDHYAVQTIERNNIIAEDLNSDFTQSKKEVKRQELNVTPTTSDKIDVKLIKSNKLKLDSIVFDDLVLTYDSINAGDKLKRKYFFTNRNDYPIEVVSTYPDCGCTAPSFPFLPIEKGGRGFIGVDYNSVGKHGKQVSNIYIKFKGIKEEKIIKLIGYVKGED